MRKLAGLGFILVIAGLAVFWLLTRPAGLSSQVLATLNDHPADPTRGEAVFWAAGCAGCHAAPGLEMDAPTEDRLRLGGGHSFETPFGTFLAPNVSMHPSYGIGSWQLEDFARAVMLGVSPDGQHYYPAFPYASYVHAQPEDIADLWAFWQTLPMVETPSEPHDLSFPFTVRRGLGLWKLLNVSEDFVLPDRDDPQLMRGRYLVEGLGHCAECHTPRDAFGGLDRGGWLSGAPNPSGRGRIPELPPENWSALDITAYLQSGFTPEFDVVGGSMAEVIANMSRLPASDRDAIATYLLAFRSSPNQ